jgi:hypothetical protein
LVEKYEDDSTEFKRFYGIVESRSINKTATNRFITLKCYDYIAKLKHLDIDLEVEGTRQKVSNETLTPTYLSAPNDDLAQLFNFANNDIATKPLPLIRIVDENHTNNEESVYDGFDIYYALGQLKLGTPLNVRNNYSVKATYYHYTLGVYVEDVIEDILTQEDGYGNYLFGETSPQGVIDNHLTSNYENEEGTGTTDTLTPNVSTTEIEILTTLTSPVSSGDTSIIIDSTDGFPSSGEATINGDTFTWTGKTSTTLTGIPAAGSNSLSAHQAGDYVTYTGSYSAGQVWSLKYNNLTSDLTTSDFDLPIGSTVDYVKKRTGKVILDSAISTSTTVTCDTNYSFKTIQTSNVEINRIVFRKREVANRLEALKKVKEYVAPNYIIRTQGDDKIWASFMSQSTTEDYDLELVQSLNYMEDQDLYTRVHMWAKNKNPTNIMFGDDVDYSSDTESDYTGTVSKEELSYFGEEKSGVLSDWASGVLEEAKLLNQTSTQELIEYVKDKYIDKDSPTQPSTGYHIYGTVISNDRGEIILGTTIPIVYVNNVIIDNNVHQQTSVPVKVKQTTKTETSGGGKSKSVSTKTWYYYEVIFPHTNLVPDEEILLYDSQGVLQYTIDANDPNVNYAEGIWTIPGIERNDVAETLSTATYYVLYSQDDLDIEYEDVLFKIHRNIIPEPDNVSVAATFEYWSIAVGIRDIEAIIDGRRDTQLQLQFFGEPPVDFHLATVDLGDSYNIQAIDMVAGFFKPDDTRKFDIGFRLSMQYSTDGTNFYAISDETENFELEGGEAKSFEEDDLGSGFQARYLKFNLQGVDKIKYGRGRYVVAITELAVYTDIVIDSEATLIPTTTLTADVNPGDTTINVNDTSAFSEPESGVATATAYLDKDSDKSFTYTGLTSTSFTGCFVDSGISASSGDYVVQSIYSDTTMYDDDGLLPQLGDRLYTKNLISDRNLFLQSQLDNITKAYLEEFYKEHSKIQATVIYAPYLKIGQTVLVTDTYNDVSDRYFIDSIQDNRGTYGLTLAKYP